MKLKNTIRWILILCFLVLSSSFEIDEISNSKYNPNSYQCQIRNRLDYSRKDSLKLIFYVILVIDDFEIPPRVTARNKMKGLIDCFQDTSKDFAANLILYHLTGENAKNYYYKFKTIDEWRLKYKAKELEFWTNRFKD